jgi:hypothetical protein
MCCNLGSTSFIRRKRYSGETLYVLIVFLMRGHFRRGLSHTSVETVQGPLNMKVLIDHLACCISCLKGFSTFFSHTVLHHYWPAATGKSRRSPWVNNLHMLLQRNSLTSVTGSDVALFHVLLNSHVAQSRLNQHMATHITAETCCTGSALPWRLCMHNKSTLENSRNTHVMRAHCGHYVCRGLMVKLQSQLILKPWQSRTVPPPDCLLLSK